MSTMFADTLLIVFISVCTALLAEGECGCFPDFRAVPLEKDSRPGVPRATSLACLRAHLLYSGVGGLRATRGQEREGPCGLGYPGSFGVE